MLAHTPAFSAPAVPVDPRAALVRRGRQLAILTLVATSAEAVVGVSAGLAAGSVALVGFGVDSVIEVTAASAALWRLGQDVDPVARASAERRVLQLIGACFLGLAAYVGAEAVAALRMRAVPDHSAVGVALAVASVLVMPLLSRAKRRVAAGLDSGALRAEAAQTAFCAYLAAILLGGLVLQHALGWWWADSVAALVMVPIIAKDGVDSLRGRGCAACAGVDGGPHAHDHPPDHPPAIIPAEDATFCESARPRTE